MNIVKVTIHAVLLTLLLVTAVMSLPGQEARYGHHGAYLLPDRGVTPGVVDASLVADTSKRPHRVDGVEHNICAPDFRTPPFRVATKSDSIKKKVCAAYGITLGCPGPDYELDDLGPIEAGFKNVQANLWPQPIAQARVKDHQVEDTLGGPRGLICQGKISLKDAQNCIVTDWVACGARVKTLEGGTK
jgi:hypothetical protein